MLSLSHENPTNIIEALNATADILSDGYFEQIYPKEPQLKWN